MSLPKINTPEYTLNVPSTDEEIRYRPFLVKEEKVLLIAQETGTDKATYDAIRTIIKSCCLDQVDIDKLPLFDMEYIFLNIRSKSVGEIAKLKVKCPDDEETEVDVEVDLSKIKVEMDDKHDARIQLTEKPNIGVLMSYPNFATITNQSIETEKGKETEKLFDMISDCMYQIWEGEETYDAMDYSVKERKNFLESLSHEQFEKLQNFFDTMPTLKHDIEVTNPKTNVTSTITLRGLNSFF